ncbi:hypothetical protein PHYSODRAFT_499075, partial [Phytophthora sojae]
MSCLGGRAYLFREYPSTLEAAITLAMQEEFSLRQAKLHAHVARPQPRPVVRTGGPEPMDLSSAATAGPQYRSLCSGVHGPLDAGRPTGNAVPRVDLGHATLRTAAPSEVHSHCKNQDDKPDLVILNFVETFIVLDLDDKFDIVLGMPWLARHDPVIDWQKRTLVRFGRDSGTVSDGPVAATHASTGTRDSPLETAPNTAVPERPGRARAHAQEQ